MYTFATRQTSVLVRVQWPGEGAVVVRSESPSG
jgi:hypothetical protein